MRSLRHSKRHRNQPKESDMPRNLIGGRNPANVPAMVAAGLLTKAEGERVKARAARQKKAKAKVRKK
jgi:hypothetical protein